MQADLTPDTFAFFADLEANNSKKFWQSNKSRYEAKVKDPFATLLNSLEDPWGPFKTFRMNRDVRFSADKSPYKTMHGAVSRVSPYRYLHVDKQGVLIVAGAYIFTKEQLSDYRDSLLDEVRADHFRNIGVDLVECGIVLEEGGAKPLKTTPRGIDPNHPMICYMRWKGLMATKRVKPEIQLTIKELAETVSSFWRDTEAFVNWLPKT